MYLSSSRIATSPRSGALIISTVLLFALALVPAAALSSEEPVYTARFSNLAAKGYDVVAYFEAGAPVEGSKAHEVRYRGVTWRFSSAANRTKFEENPERYAPRYGGYCAWAMAQGKKAPGDPEFWKIVDGKLYLNYDANVQQDWEVDIPGFIESADREWTDLTRP